MCIRDSIATVTDQGPGTYRDDLITIQNMQTKIDTPAVMMTKHDGEILRNALKEGKKLKVSISMDLNTRKSVAHYVSVSYTHLDVYKRQESNRQRG